MQQILCENVKKDNMQNWFKYQCCALLYAYDEIVDKINNAIENTAEENLFKSELISANTQHLRKLVIDAEEFLMYLEASNNDTPKRQIGYNRSVKGFDSLWYANLLFNGIVDYSNNACFINLAFLMRDSIELRIRKALGISQILLNDKSAKIANDDFVDFIFDNDNIKLPNINKAIVKKIFDWCNFHIHKGIVLYEWQLVLIYEYMQPLFASGETSTQLHISGAVQMNESYYKNSLASELETFLTQKNPKNIGIKVFLDMDPEALLIK